MTAPPRARQATIRVRPDDPIKALVAYLDDARALLDKLRDMPRLSAADIPYVRSALQAAIYDVPAEQDCGACKEARGEMCTRHVERARQCAHWTQLWHQLGGTA